MAGVQLVNFVLLSVNLVGRIDELTLGEQSYGEVAAAFDVRAAQRNLPNENVSFRSA